MDCNNRKMRETRRQIKREEKMTNMYTRFLFDLAIYIFKDKMNLDNNTIKNFVECYNKTINSINSQELSFNDIRRMSSESLKEIYETNKNDG